MRFNPSSENEQAGLLAFQNEQHYYFLCKTIVNQKPTIQLWKSAVTKQNKQQELLKSCTINVPLSHPIYFKIEANGNYYSFYYAVQQHQWLLLQNNVDARFLSTEVAGGFVGTIYAMYATANGVVSNNIASFNWFEVKSNDTVYTNLFKK